MITIAVINRSTVLTDGIVAAAVPAFDTQVKRDLGPEWGVAAEVNFYPKGVAVPRKAWQLVILDDSDQAGALGYHELTAAGRPLGRVFAATDRYYGLKWTVTASHEICEMLVDPDCVLAAQVGDQPVFVAYEICDACEADEYGYAIGPTMVSDYLNKAWFQPQGRVPYDKMGRLDAPLSMLPGGYMSVFRNGQWGQIQAQTPPGRKSRAVRAQRGLRRGLADTFTTSTTEHQDPLTTLVTDLL